MEEISAEPCRKGIAEDTGFWVESETQDFLTDSRVPLAATEFDFGKFGHRSAVWRGGCLDQAAFLFSWLGFALPLLLFLGLGLGEDLLTGVKSDLCDSL